MWKDIKKMYYVYLQQGLGSPEVDLEFKSEDFGVSVDLFVCLPNCPFWGLLNAGGGMVSRHRVCQSALCYCTKELTD
jgi:hypothetical protein